MGKLEEKLQVQKEFEEALSSQYYEEHGRPMSAALRFSKFTKRLMKPVEYQLEETQAEFEMWCLARDYYRSRSSNHSQDAHQRPLNAPDSNPST